MRSPGDSQLVHLLTKKSLCGCQRRSRSRERTGVTLAAASGALVDNEDITPVFVIKTNLDFWQVCLDLSIFVLILS